MLICTEKRDRRDRHNDKDREKTDEEKARDMIKKAKVEDDEYKTEEQTYYRCDIIAITLYPVWCCNFVKTYLNLIRRK